MANKHVIPVQARTIVGKQTKKLRTDAYLIANLSVPGNASIALKTSYHDFEKMLNQAGESGLFYLEDKENKKEYPVLIDEIQVHPVTEAILHVSFKQVNLKEKVESEIPLEFIGEVDISGSVTVTVRDSILVEALPTDLPEKIEVDVTTLQEIGDSIVVADLDIDTSKVSLVLGEDQDPADMPVVLIQEQREEEPEETEEPTEPELVGGEEASESEAEEATEAPAEEEEKATE